MQQTIIYEPSDDSFLLQKHVKKLATGLVLDMGTGSAIQANTAAKKTSVKKVIAIDIQKGVIEHCKKTIKNKKIQFYQSDLFEIFNKNQLLKNLKFDTIIFNPPYLPAEVRLQDMTLDGGKKGYEIIEKFLLQVNNYLTSNGKILLLFSSLTNKEKIHEILIKNFQLPQNLETKKIFFEELYIYLIEKNNLQQELEKNKFTNISYFTKGHRGFLHKANFNKKKVMIKSNNPKSQAINRIQNETKWLKLLNKYNIGPKILKASDNFVAYEFIDGIFFPEFLEKSSKKDVLNIIEKLIKQLYTLDKLNTNKEEMHHPFKHILIKGKKPIMIDFERCHKTIKPKNITQFCQFLIGKKIKHLLIKKKININRDNLIKAAKVYKNKISPKNLEKIKSLILK
tara:strand:+ start:43879 stop:45066 length:1188 start_codon:yes stop_codon:yes gene_type:complete